MRKREREREMEGNNIGENQRRKEIEGSDHGEKGNEEVELRKMIASHPLYELLIESHFNCLKVGLGETEEFEIPNDAWKKLTNSKFKANTSPSSSELDQFMEGYCMALSKLKEAMEEPTKEAKAFINATYVQLKELNEPNNPKELSH